MTTEVTYWNSSSARTATTSGGRIPIRIRTPPVTPSKMRLAVLCLLQANSTPLRNMVSVSLPSSPGLHHNSSSDPRSRTRVVFCLVELPCQGDRSQAAGLTSQARRHDVIINMFQQAFALKITIQQFANFPADFL